MHQVESLYIHFPFCRHLCNYCDFFKKKTSATEVKGELSGFHRRLQEEFDQLMPLMQENSASVAPLKTVYIGGGTPSLWSSEGADFLKAFFVENKIQLIDDCEFTLEVNPGTWTEEGLTKWKELGVNRFSLGIQSLNEDFLPIIDRVHSLQDSTETLEFFQNNFDNFSVDFMIGLPFSTEKGRDIIDELRQIIEFQPKHISLYILTVPGNYLHYNKLPEDEFIRNEFLQMSKFLNEHGFDHYEVSNFAKPGFESRHNLQYWECNSVLALGPSATGVFYLDKSGTRYKWKTNKVEVNEEHLDNEAVQLEQLYMRLRVNTGFEYKKIFNEEQSFIFAKLITDWGKRGLVETLYPLRLSASGYVILDSLIDEVFRKISMP